MNSFLHTMLVWLIRIMGLVITGYGVYLLNNGLQDGFQLNEFGDDWTALIYILIGALFFYNAYLFQRLKRKMDQDR